MRIDVRMHPRLPAHRRAVSPRVHLLLVSGFLLGVALYAIAFITSATTMTAKDQSNLFSGTARTYFTTLVGQMDAPRSHTGQVAVLDATVPDGAVVTAFAPLNHLLYDLPIVSEGAAVDQLRQETFKVKSDGSLVPVRFQRASGTSRGLPISVVVGSSGVKPMPATSRTPAHRSEVTGGSCYSSSRTGGRIDVRLVSPVNASSSWLLVRLSTSSGGSVNVSTLSGGTSTVVGAIDLAPGSGPTSYLLPLSQRALDQVRLSTETVGQDLCVSSIDVGTFSTS